MKYHNTYHHIIRACHHKCYHSHKTPMITSGENKIFCESQIVKKKDFARKVKEPQNFKAIVDFFFLIFQYLTYSITAELLLLLF